MCIALDIIYKGQVVYIIFKLSAKSVFTVTVLDLREQDMMELSRMSVLPGNQISFQARKTACRLTRA